MLGYEPGVFLPEGLAWTIEYARQPKAVLSDNLSETLGSIPRLVTDRHLTRRGRHFWRKRKGVIHALLQ